MSELNFFRGTPDLGTAKASRPPVVLVVEDSDEDFDTLCEVVRLSGMACALHRVMSGDEALLLLGVGEAAGGAIKPALVLLDLNSHGVDGRDVLLALKTHPARERFPVVVLTTSANPHDIADCYAAGANAYHVKPVRHDQYTATLCALLHYWLRTAVLPTTAQGAS